jgi:hypothetical protein
MRLLHFIPSLVQGGAQRQISYLTPELARMGHEVHLACMNLGANLPRLNESGVFMHRLLHGNKYDPFILMDLVRLIRHIKPDLMQTWLVQSGGWPRVLPGHPGYCGSPLPEERILTPLGVSCRL